MGAGEGWEALRAGRTAAGPRRSGGRLWLAVALSLLLGGVLMGTAPAAHAGPAGALTVAQLHLIDLTCLNQNDYFGSDEPYLKVNGVRVWSGSNVDPFDTEWVNYWYTFDEVVRVELWEDDGGWTGDDDWMATLYMWAGEAGTGVHEIWTDNGPGRYALRYEVV